MERRKAEKQIWRIRRTVSIYVYARVCVCVRYVHGRCACNVHVWQCFSTRLRSWQLALSRSSPPLRPRSSAKLGWTRSPIRAPPSLAATRRDATRGPRAAIARSTLVENRSPSWRSSQPVTSPSPAPRFERVSGVEGKEPRREGCHELSPRFTHRIIQ